MRTAYMFQVAVFVSMSVLAGCSSSSDQTGTLTQSNLTQFIEQYKSKEADPAAIIKRDVTLPIVGNQMTKAGDFTYLRSAPSLKYPAGIDYVLIMCPQASGRSSLAVDEKATVTFSSLVFMGVMNSEFRISPANTACVIAGAPDSVGSESVADASRAEVSIVGSTNELADGWRVLWRSSEETGDTYGYFFRTGSEVDRKIQASCTNEQVCRFDIEFVDLDATRVRNALGENAGDISYYGEIVGVTVTRNK